MKPSPRQKRDITRRGLRSDKNVLYYLNLKAIAADQSMIEAVFTRGLPQNRLELSQIIANLKGVVSTKTLLALLLCVSNVDDEMKEVKKEKTGST